MKLVIDGYNVIYRARLAQTGSLEEQRDALIQMAAEHRQKKNVETFVFFDSRSTAEFWDRPDHPFVKVIFANGESADDAMIGWLSKQNNREQIEVATDDKSLRDRSKHLNAKWISVEELMHRFGRASKTKPSKNNQPQNFESDKPTNNYYLSDEINKTLPWGK